MPKPIWIIKSLRVWRRKIHKFKLKIMHEDNEVNEVIDNYCRRDERIKINKL